MGDGAGRDSAYQTFGSGTYQIFPMGFQQSLMNQIIVLGIAILDQRPLHGLFMGIRGYIYPFHGSGIQTCIVHHR